MFPVRYSEIVCDSRVLLGLLGRMERHQHQRKRLTLDRRGIWSHHQFLEIVVRDGCCFRYQSLGVGGAQFLRVPLQDDPC